VPHKRLLKAQHQQKHPLNLQPLWVCEISFSPTKVGENVMFHQFFEKVGEKSFNNVLMA